MSLRLKLLIVMIAAMLFSCGPLIYLSYNKTSNLYFDAEKVVFDQLVAAVDETLNANYASLLSEEIDVVLTEKRQMSNVGILVGGMVRDANGDLSEENVARWRRRIEPFGMRISFYSDTGTPKSVEPYVAQVMSESKTEVRGQHYRDFLKPPIVESVQMRFAVHCPPSGQPNILGFQWIQGVGTLVLSKPISTTISTNQWIEERLMRSLTSTIEHMCKDTMATVRIQRGKDVPGMHAGDVTFQGISLDAWVAARYEEKTQGTAGPAGGQFLYQIGYFDPLDWFIVASVPVAALKEPATKFSQDLVVVCGSIVAVCAFLGVLFLVFQLKPLQLLTERAQVLGSETFDRPDGFERHARGLPVGRRDEIGQLSAAFSNMLMQLQQNVAKLVSTTASKERMQGELNAARDIQQGILANPNSAPQCPGYRAAAFLAPAKEVAGDLYDFFTAPDGRQVIVVGDVSDKGTSAALFMAMTLSVLRTTLAEGLSPAQAMIRCNNQLARNNPGCMFVTLWIGLFDPQSGQLTYANGAHPSPAIIQDDGSVRILDALAGPLVGALDGMDYTDSVTVLKPGESCLVYTDGVSEAMNANKELFGEERVTRLLEGRTDLDCRGVIDLVLSALAEHRGDEAQNDDITMLCFRRERV